MVFGTARVGSLEIAPVEGEPAVFLFFFSCVRNQSAIKELGFSSGFNGYKGA
jgi:hypothetical protein